MATLKQQIFENQLKKKLARMQEIEENKKLLKEQEMYQYFGKADRDSRLRAAILKRIMSNKEVVSEEVSAIRAYNEMRIQEEIKKQEELRKQIEEEKEKRMIVEKRLAGYKTYSPQKLLNISCVAVNKKNPTNSKNSSFRSNKKLLLKPLKVKDINKKLLSKKTRKVNTEIIKESNHINEEAISENIEVKDTDHKHIKDNKEDYIESNMKEENVTELNHKKGVKSVVLSPMNKYKGNRKINIMFTRKDINNALSIVKSHNPSRRSLVQHFDRKCKNLLSTQVNRVLSKSKEDKPKYLECDNVLDIVSIREELKDS